VPRETDPRVPTSFRLRKSAIRQLKLLADQDDRSQASMLERLIEEAHGRRNGKRKRAA